jgi:hypothetical protein
VFYAESPPVYAGDSEEARADIKRDGNATLSGANTSLIEEGDMIRFNYQDPLYRIVTAGSQIRFSSDTPGTPLPRPEADLPMSVPFQIYRKPRQATGAPVMLTGNVVIDLTKSGMGAGGTEFQEGGSRQLIIMFSPAGNVDRVYINDKSSLTPTSPIHLLLGRFDKVGKEEQLKDKMNFWVSIGNQSGQVTTSPIMTGSGGTGGVREARRDAISMLGMGGN